MKGNRKSVRSKRHRIVYLKKMTLCMTALILAVCLSVFAGKGLVSAHGNQKESLIDYRYYKSIQVNTGDTLWSIAEEYMDDSYESVYDYIDELKEINNLDSSDIQESHYLTVSYTDQEFR